MKAKESGVEFLAARVRGIVRVYRNTGFKTKVLTVSRRSAIRGIDWAPAGASVGTMPFKVLDMLFNHPLTDQGLDPFQLDGAKVLQESPVAG